MARPLRIDEEDTFCHVLNRGNERRAIFRDEHDYEGFQDRLGRCSQRFSLDIFAYVLMGNHYHLLAKTHEANLSAAMQWLQVAYGSWHNHRHRRSGHLFQGRFKSFLIHETQYLQRLLLWRQGRFRLGEIGLAFGVKDSAVSQACRRAERRLAGRVPSEEASCMWLSSEPWPPIASMTARIESSRVR